MQDIKYSTETTHYTQYTEQDIQYRIFTVHNVYNTSRQTQGIQGRLYTINGAHNILIHGIYKIPGCTISNIPSIQKYAMHTA